MLTKSRLKQYIFLAIAFVLLTLSYSANVFHISKTGPYQFYLDKMDEGFVVGRMLRSDKEGVFSKGGLTGINVYTPEGESNYYEQAAVDQYKYYVTDSDIPERFFPYMSQTGGQAMMYSILQKILPFDGSTKFNIFRVLNAALAAMCFVLILGWIFRNFSFTSSIVTFVLIFLSPWITNFSHNLWWALWSFYIPFISMLLFLEKRHANPGKYSDKHMYIILFLSVLAKGIFTGFEFVTTTLFSALCPVVYYYLLRQESFKELVKKLFKLGVVIGAALLCNMAILITQIKFLMGTFEAGVKHIAYSFVKRSSFGVIETTEYNDTPKSILNEVFIKYFNGNAFNWGFTSTSFEFRFAYFILILAVCSLIIWQISKKMSVEVRNKYKALLYTSYFAILSPLSWIIVFKQHAYVHDFLDYIVWYIPFLIFVFLIFGQTIQLIYSHIRNKNLPV